MAATTDALVLPGSNSALITVPLIDGDEPPHRPKPPVTSTATELQVAPETGSRITFPLIVLLGAVAVLVTPAVAAIPKAAAAPRAGALPAGPGLPERPAPLPSLPKIFPPSPLPHPAMKATTQTVVSICAL